MAQGQQGTEEGQGKDGSTTSVEPVECNESSMVLAENRGGAGLEAAWHKILISKPVNKPNTLDAKGSCFHFLIH